MTLKAFQHRVFLFVPVLIAVLSTASNAAIIRVKWDSPNNGPGNDWSHAYRTVTAGIAASVSGDEIWVSGDSAHPYFERITLKAGVGLYGGFAGTETIRAARDWKANVTVLDGSGAGIAVTAPSGATATTVLDGFSVRSGSPGISCDSSSPTISNNTLLENGNGIECWNSAALISNNTITQNSSTAVYCFASSALITNNTISRNIVGIQCGRSSSPTQITNNIISANDIGISLYWCDPLIANNIVSGNGWGIYCYVAAPIVKSNTISGNGTGIISDGEDAAITSAPTLSNNIVAFNSTGIYCTSFGTAVLGNNCVYNPGGRNYQGLTAGPDISADPKFVSAVYGKLHIQPDSPCTGMGAYPSDGTAWPAYVPVVVRVSPSGSDEAAHDGSSWSLAKRTVQAGVDAASTAGGDVWVAAGVYAEHVLLRPYAYVYGGFAGVESVRGERNVRVNRTVLDANGSGNVVKGGGGSCSTLDGFTLTNSGIGDGVGGVYCGYSSPTIANNSISVKGSGIICGGLVSPHIANNTISGGTYGIRCPDNGAPVITNNTITANTVYGIDCSSPYASIINNIIAFNSKGIRGASGSVNETTTLKSNCVYNPGGANYDGLAPGAGDISLDPFFVNRSVGDFHLSHLSPCINAGFDSAVLPGYLDMDGRPRIAGAHVDIGADEYEPPSIPAVTDDGITTTSLSQLHATWISFDPENGIAEYQYAIGTSPTDPGTGYTLAWKSAGTANDVIETGLALIPGQSYYWYLKARNGVGRWSDGAGVTDGIVASPVAHLGDVKSLTPDSAFTLNGLIASTSSTDFAGFVYVQDSGRAAGLRVNTTAPINRGDIISLAGRVRRVDGEWQIDLLQPPAVVAGVAPTPMHIVQRAISTDPNEDLTPDWGLNPAGLLVKISGRITRINTTDHVIYVNDGTSLTDGLGPSDNPYVGIRVGYRTMTPPLVGKRITVTGILSVEKTTLVDDAFVNGEYRLAGETLYVPILRPRNQADIVVVL